MDYKIILDMKNGQKYEFIGFNYEQAVLMRQHIIDCKDDFLPFPENYYKEQRYIRVSDISVISIGVDN